MQSETHDAVYRNINALLDFPKLPIEASDMEYLGSTCIHGDDNTIYFSDLDRLEETLYHEYGHQILKSITKLRFNRHKKSIHEAFAFWFMETMTAKMDIAETYRDRDIILHYYNAFRSYDTEYVLNNIDDIIKEHKPKSRLTDIIPRLGRL